MESVLIVRYGEISLKGRNRGYFEDTLITNLRLRLRKYRDIRLHKKDSRIYIHVHDNDPTGIMAQIKPVFGVVSISPAFGCATDFEQICALARTVTEQAIRSRKISSFKVQGKRADKTYPLESMAIGREIGAYLLKSFPGLKVDLTQPDLTVYVEVRDQAYVYTEKIPGYGGLPYGTGGKGLLLLSGGIDSPVAGWLMAKRGLVIEALHFHSYPFTSERAKEKVIELSRLLSTYCRRITLHTVNLLEIQTAIREHCPEDFFTIISRRFMMFIAARVAADNHCQALITGENIAQVASQTLQSLQVTNAAVELPVFRPLIAMDKVDIIRLAEEIGTFQTSILPYEDCCTVFLPRHPVTKPKLEKVLNYESALAVDDLVAQALKSLETLEIHPDYQ